MNVPPIRFDVSCDPQNARVVRAAAGSSASMLGFSVDGVDDVRLLADELFNCLVETSADRAWCEIAFGRHELRLSVSGQPLGAASAETVDVLDMIARVIAPGYELTNAPGSFGFVGRIGEPSNQSRRRVAPRA